MLEAAVVHPTNTKRIAWPAIFAGAVVTLVVQLVLAVLGIALGMNVVQAQGADQVGSGLAMGAAIWWAVSALIALFAGGWVAGHLAGVSSRLDASLHGFLNWGVATLLTIVLIAGGAGSLIGGAMNLVGSGVQTAAQATGSGSSAGIDVDQAQEAARELRDRMANMEGQAAAQATQAAGGTAKAAWSAFAALVLGAAAAWFGGSLGARDRRVVVAST